MDSGREEVLGALLPGHKGHAVLFGELTSESFAPAGLLGRRAGLSGPGRRGAGVTPLVDDRHAIPPEEVGRVAPRPEALLRELPGIHQIERLDRGERPTNPEAATGKSAREELL